MNLRLVDVRSTEYVIEFIITNYCIQKISNIFAYETN